MVKRNIQIWIDTDVKKRLKQKSMETGLPIKELIKRLVDKTNNNGKKNIFDIKL